MQQRSQRKVLQVLRSLLRISRSDLYVVKDEGRMGVKDVDHFQSLILEEYRLHRHVTDRTLQKTLRTRAVDTLALWNALREQQVS